MPRARILALLDIDGVLSIEDPANLAARREHWPGCGPVWPVPFADALIRALDRDARLAPAWLSYWGERAWRWNSRAGTARWPVVFPLSLARQRAARHWAKSAVLPAAASAGATARVPDDKLFAVRFVLRRQPMRRVLWIEDGFSPEAIAWAGGQSGRVRLVDATEETACAFLLAHHDDADAAARSFTDACLASFGDS